MLLDNNNSQPLLNLYHGSLIFSLSLSISNTNNINTKVQSLGRNKVQGFEGIDMFNLNCVAKMFAQNRLKNLQECLLK